MIGAGEIGLLGFLMMITFMRDTPQSQGFLLGNEAPAPNGNAKNQ